MPIHELAALGAAACWATSAMISPVPAAHLGAPAFNRLRQSLVLLMLVAYVAWTGAWATLRPHDVGLILLSGLIGIFLGDTLLFACMNRLGPRRSSILFAMNAPIAAILGWLALNEVLSLQAVLGIVLSFAGVTMAIYFGSSANSNANNKTVSDSKPIDVLHGALWAGVAIGIGSALCQAVASLIMRPIMKSGVDPFAASMLRVGIGAAALTVLLQLPVPAVKQRNPLNQRVVLLTALSGFFALALGMTLLLFALSGGKVGIVSTLSATTPVMILPMIWLKTGLRPALGAWAGALVTMAGLAMIFMR